MKKNGANFADINQIERRHAMGETPEDISNATGIVIEVVNRFLPDDVVEEVDDVDDVDDNDEEED